MPKINGKQIAEVVRRGGKVVVDINPNNGGARFKLLHEPKGKYSPWDEITKFQAKGYLSEKEFKRAELLHRARAGNPSFRDRLDAVQELRKIK